MHLEYLLVDIWVYNLLTGCRHLIFAVRKRCVCQCSCKGWWQVARKRVCLERKGHPPPYLGGTHARVPQLPPSYLEAGGGSMTHSRW